MKKTVLTFGLIAGLILSIMMVCTMPFIDEIHDNGEIIGYTTMVLSFAMIFFAVRSYRDNTLGGYISFGKAFTIGILITAIACTLYVTTWEILWHNFMPDFAEKCTNMMIEKMKKDGASPEKMKETMDFMQLYNTNMFVNVAISFLEPLPVGVLITLISSLILKKKPAVAA